MYTLGLMKNENSLVMGRVVSQHGENDSSCAELRFSDFFLQLPVDITIKILLLTGPDVFVRLKTLNTAHAAHFRSFEASFGVHWFVQVEGSSLLCTASAAQLPSSYARKLEVYFESSEESDIVCNQLANEESYSEDSSITKVTHLRFTGTRRWVVPDSCSLPRPSRETLWSYSLPTSFKCFSALKVLDCCDNNSITTIPKLCNTLQVLRLSRFVSLELLPTSLPDGLLELDISNCWSLLQWPSKFPSCLQVLKCDSIREELIQQLGTRILLPESLLELHMAKHDIDVFPIPILPSRLLVLNVSYIPISELPLLPSTLLELYIDSCDFTGHVPTLPPTLQVFCGANNSFTDLAPLPETLKVLNIRNNQLTALPDPLPLKLRHFDCSENTRLTSLPDTLPPGLQVLKCSGNGHLQQLPCILPLNLRVLDCHRCCNLSQLPSNLPPRLEILDCSCNASLSSLPTNLPQSLKRLLCSNNRRLTELPPLPDGLLFLDYRVTPLKEIPTPKPIWLTISR